MSRNAEYIHLKLKPQMDGLKGKSDKAREKYGKQEDKAQRNPQNIVQRPNRNHGTRP